MRTVLLWCVLCGAACGQSNLQVESISRRVEAVDGSLTRMRDSFEPFIGSNTLFVQASTQSWAQQDVTIGSGICARSYIGAADNFARASSDFTVHFTIPVIMEVGLSFEVQNGIDGAFSFFGSGISIQSGGEDVFHERLMLDAGGYNMMMQTQTVGGSHLASACIAPFVIPEPSTFAPALLVLFSAIAHRYWFRARAIAGIR